MKIKTDRGSLQNYFLYSYFFSINIENFNPTGYFSVSKLAGILYIISAFLSIRVFSSLNRQQLYFYWPIIIFAFYLSIISLINFNAMSTRFIDIAFIQNLLIFMVLINHVRKDSLVLEKGMFALSIGSITVSVLMFLGIGLTEVPEDSLGLINRIGFFNAGLNEIALKLSAGLVIIISLLYENTLKLKKWTRILLAMTVPLIVITILGTASRTAFLILPICGLTWYGFKLMESNNKFYSLIFGLFSIIIFFSPIIYLGLQFEEFQLLATRLEDIGGVGDFSEMGRFSLWIGFFSLIFENLIFGNGYSGFDLIAFQYFGFVESPHNVLLEVMLYTGLIGFFLYILFLSRIFLASYKLFKLKKRILPTVIIPIALAFIIILQGLNEKICWLILAYIIGSYMHYFKKFKKI